MSKIFTMFASAMQSIKNIVDKTIAYENNKYPYSVTAHDNTAQR